jgi:hypothetical protein
MKMMNLLLSVGLFMVGMVFGYVLSGTPVFAQQQQQPQPPHQPQNPVPPARPPWMAEQKPPSTTPPSFSDISCGNSRMCLAISNYVPVVYPTMFMARNIDFGTSAQIIDGMSCENCNFEGTTLIYGGGTFQLKNPNHVNVGNLHLIGAAANTAALLVYLGVIPQGPKPTPTLPPDRPVLANLTSVTPHLDFSATNTGN